MNYSNKHNKKLRRLCLLLALLLSVWGSVSVFAEDPKDPLEQTQVGESSEQETEAELTAMPSLTEIVEEKLTSMGALREKAAKHQSEFDALSETKEALNSLTPAQLQEAEKKANTLLTDIDRTLAELPALPALFETAYTEWAAATDKEWEMPDGWEDFTRDAWNALPQSDPTAQQKLDEQIRTLKDSVAEIQEQLDTLKNNVESLQNEVQPLIENFTWKDDVNSRLDKVEASVSSLANPAETNEQRPPASDSFRFYCLLAAFFVNLIFGILALVKASKAPSAPKIDLKDFAGKSSVTELNGKLIALQNSIDALSKANSKLKEEQERLSSELKKRKSELSSNSAGGSGGSGESGGNKGPKKGSPDTGRLTGEKLHLNYSPISETNCYFMPLANGEYELTDKNYILLTRPDSGINELKGWKGKGLFFVYDAEVDGKRCSESEVGQISGFFSIGSVKMYPTVIRLSSGNYMLQSKGLLEMKR